MQVPRLGGRIRAELIRQRGPEALVGIQGCGVVGRSVVGRHERAGGLLVEGIRPGRGPGRLQGRIRVAHLEGRPPRRASGLPQDPIGRRSNVVDPDRVGLTFQDGPGEQRARPAGGRERQRWLGAREPGPRLLRQPGGDVEIHVHRPHHQAVAVAVAPDGLRAQDAPETADERGHVLLVPRRRVACPQGVRDLVRGEGPATAGGHQLEQLPALAASHLAFRQGPASAHHAERAHQVDQRGFGWHRSLGQHRPQGGLGGGKPSAGGGGGPGAAGARPPPSSLPRIEAGDNATHALRRSLSSDVHAFDREMPVGDLEDHQ